MHIPDYIAFGILFILMTWAVTAHLHHGWLAIWSQADENYRQWGVVYIAVDSDGKTASRDDGLPPEPPWARHPGSDRPLGRWWQGDRRSIVCSESNIVNRSDEVARDKVYKST